MLTFGSQDGGVVSFHYKKFVIILAEKILPIDLPEQEVHFVYLSQMFFYSLQIQSHHCSPE